MNYVVYFKLLFSFMILHCNVIQFNGQYYLFCMCARLLLLTVHTYKALFDDMHMTCYAQKCLENMTHPVQCESARLIYMNIMITKGILQIIKIRKIQHHLCTGEIIRKWIGKTSSQIRKTFKTFLEQEMYLSSLIEQCTNNIKCKSLFFAHVTPVADIIFNSITHRPRMHKSKTYN